MVAGKERLHEAKIMSIERSGTDTGILISIQDDEAQIVSENKFNSGV